LEAAIPGVGEVEGVKGLAEFSIHNYDLEGPADMGDFACLSAAALQKVQHFDQCGLQVLGPPALSHQDRRPFQVESANVHPWLQLAIQF